ncbi:MAG: amidase family protein [Acidimicrobiales bacterium]
MNTGRPGQGSINLDMAGVGSLGRWLAEGSLNSRSLVTACLERIDVRDLPFGAIRMIVDDAVAQAEASDEHRRRHGPRSPLEGIPVILKDNIDVAGLPTTAGSLALAGSVPDRDAHLVTRLRESGAVIVAKANLSELANFLTEGMPSGYSSLGGQVLNPYDLALTPSGSSSGSAAAVALGLAPLAVGTETDGSIISPAVHQSLVGLKPTLGLVSRRGIFPIAPSQDTAGPMAGGVADAAALLAVMAGTDADDPATAGAEETATRLGSLRLDPSVLSRSGLGLVAVRGKEGDAPSRPLIEDEAAALERAGGHLRDVELPAQNFEDELFVLRYEFAPAVTAYFAGWPASGGPRSLAEVAAWNRAHPDVALKFGQTHVDAALAIDHTAQRDDYLEARRRDQAAAAEALESAMAGLDVLIFRGDEGAGWAARSGWPSVCVPTGYSARSRRPRGVTLVGRAWTDDHLLSVAAGVEAACGRRRPPSQINPAVFHRLKGS